MKGIIARKELRRDSCKLLADCYYQPDELLRATISSVDASRGGIFSEVAKNLLVSDDMEMLQVDYSRLFIGPHGLLAPPYGSLYLENAKTLMGESTLDVKRRYAEEGLILSAREAPDHITIELEFMYFLIHREIEALFKSDNIRANAYTRKQEIFFKIHLARWVFDFTKNIAANARTEFYKNLAAITDSFLSEDFEDICGITPLNAKGNSDEH